MQEERVLISPSWQERLQNQNYKNWLKVGYGINMVCNAIRPYIERETKAFHSILTARLRGVPLCRCTYTRPPYHDTINCLWAKEVLNYHTKGRPIWNQSDSSLWHDSNAGYWEVAKLYMPYGCARGNSCAETDATGLLNLLLFCNYYKTNTTLVDEFKDTRNAWGHAPKHELNAAEMTKAFISMKKFLQDPELVSDPDAIGALNEVTKLESDCLIEFEDIEAKVISHLKDFIISVKDEILEKIDKNAILAKENKDILLYCMKCDADRDSILNDIMDKIETIEKREEDKSKQNGWMLNVFENSISILSLVLLALMTVARIVPCRSRVLFFFLVLNVTILEEDLVDLGCGRNTFDDPFEIKQFDFTEYMSRAREGFVGRQWLFDNITESLEVKRKKSVKGVLIVGPPGFGKSALISNLICSKLSSLSIHTQILGYHFCIHSDKNTLSGAKFVRNLANMIASRLPEYKNLLSRETFIQRILKLECLGDPSGCFEQGILAPLLRLKLRFETPRYIVVDALDECLDEKERNAGRSIVEVLQHKIKQFPSWLKVITTSRNQSNIRRKLKNLDVIELYPGDQENLRDIERYLASKLEGSVLSRVRSYGFSGIDLSVPDLVLKSQGNFLYIRLLLKYLQTRDFTSDKIPLPDSINTVYQNFFERKYDSLEKFRAPRKIFEILVATKSPVTVMELFDILSNENKDFDFDYDLLPILEDLSMYLLYSEERQSRVSVFHNSLTEWLTSDSNRGGLFYVNERKGSRALADHFLMVIHGSFTNVDPKFIYDLTTYIVVGGHLKRHTDSFLQIDPKLIKVKDKRTGFTALHLAAEAENEKFLGLLLKIFKDPNVEDSKGRTAAFMAVTFGRLENLRLLHKKGASLSAVTKRNMSVAEKSITDYTLECKRQMCGYSLLHVAAYKGHNEIVQYLIKHGSDVSLLSGTNNTAVQLAAEFGHIEIVKLLLSHGADLDNTCLYYAASHGQVEIVKFLLKMGVKDSCIPFDGIFEVSNLQRYCNTALHAAAIGNYPDVIEALLSSKHNAVNCVNCFGKEPIHEAVHHNNYRAVAEFLKHGVDTSKTCKFSVSGDLFDDKSCFRGYTPLHLAARHGFAAIVKLLLEHKADYNAIDCLGLEPIHLASCRSHADVISILVEHGADINSRDRNDMTPIHYACKCKAIEIFGKLFELGANGLALTANGKTPLNFLVEDYFIDKKFYFVDPYVINPIDPVNFESSEDNIVKSHMREHSWLTSSIKFLQSFTKADISLSELGAALGPLQSFLSYRSVLPGSIINEISIHLLGSDKHQNTRLVVLATPAPFPVDIGLAAFLRNQHTSLNHLSTSTVLPSFVKKGLSTALMTMSGKIDFECSMLAAFIHHNMVYAVDAFLQLGMDVNCEESGMSPLLAYLREGGRNMAKVLAKHNVSVDIQCGEYFKDSVFHLAAYHKLHYLQYLSIFEDPIKWEEYLKEENALFDYLFDVYEEVSKEGQLKLTRIRDGPVTVAIESHFRGSKIIDECLDDDGYTALHRAAQGGNVVAVKYFLKRGANPSLESPDQGFDALVLSIWYAIKYKPYLNLFKLSLLTSLEIEFASLTASAILKHLTKNEPFDIGCDATKKTPTLLHLAATRGMWRFIDDLFVARDRHRVTGLTANCPTKDNITPMYLAKLHGGDDCDWDNPWCKVVGVLLQNEGSMIYPDRITEYFLILNILFHELPERFDMNELNQEEIRLLSGDNKECKEFQDQGNIFTDRLLSKILWDDYHNLSYDYPLESQDGHFHLLRSQYVNIITKLEIEETNFLLTQLDYDLFLSFKLVSLKLSLHLYRSNDDRILKCVPVTMDPIPKHPAISTLNTQQIFEENFEKANPKKRSDQIEADDILDAFLLPPNMCSSKSTVDFQIIDKMSQKNRVIFNKHLETFAKGIKIAKQEIRQKKVQIGIFDSVDNLFRDYESRMYCQTKNIVYKYARFRYVLHTMKFWSTQVKKLGMYPLIPRFASERILEIFQSEEQKTMLPFLIKLAKIDPSNRYEYLKMFRFSSPPLEEQFWREPGTVKD